MSDFFLPVLDAETALARAKRDGVRLVDVRKLAAAEQSGQAVRGALRRDPFALGHDDPLTRMAEPLIVFCVHGHEVSQFAAALLKMHGRDVHYVKGGFEALKAAGASIVALEDTDGDA